MKWEMIVSLEQNSSFETWRAYVPGGWLVATIVFEWSDDTRPGPCHPDAYARGGGLTFMLDPDHEWEIEETK